MSHHFTRILRWLLVVAVIATGGCLLFQGCSNQKPTEAPSSTIVTGSDSKTVTPSSNRESFSFVSGGRNYGRIDLVLNTYPNALFEGNGIVVSNATVAPDAGYSTFSAVDYGYYIIRVVGTDNLVRYGKITVTTIGHNDPAQAVTVGINWLIQSTAGDRNLQ